MVKIGPELNKGGRIAVSAFSDGWVGAVGESDSTGVNSTFFKTFDYGV